MKSYFLKAVSALFFVFATAGLVACGGDDGGSDNSRDDNKSIVGYWETSHLNGKYDSYSFYDDGYGMYLKWEETPDSPLGNASSDYVLVFSYNLSGETLVLDFGFGYLKRFRVQNISSGFLDMYFNSTNIICTRSDRYDRNTFPDYSMAIIGGWSINDIETSKWYDVNFRADGSYESVHSGVAESGTYQVDKSRVKFSSNSSGSLLNGRIFMISHCWRTEWGSGTIHLETENGVMIKGTQKN